MGVVKADSQNTLSFIYQIPKQKPQGPTDNTRLQHKVHASRHAAWEASG